MFKKFAIAATAIALTAGAASANNSIGIQQGIDEGSHVIELSTIRADSAGIVTLETLQGVLVGMADVKAGANANTTVPLKGTLVQSDLIAKLVLNGEVAAESRIQVN